ncbi:MAG: GDSL family lipase [Planctomycetes bacterium]|nr:GDSL family lipase [Planctomycetota bacterium]
MLRHAAVLLALAGCLIGADTDPTAGPPDKALPSVAGWGFWPKYPKDWIRTFEGQLKQAKAGGIGVVFLGDSITNGWSAAGKAQWDARFAPLKAANFGIGGDSTRQVLWRIEHGLLDGITPKVIVVAIGTNNLYGDYNAGTEAEIAAGIKACVDAARAKVPTAKILIVGMLPRQNAYFCDRIATVNAITAKLDDGAAVRYVDPGAAFLEAPGKVKADLYREDQVHLVTAGYAVLVEAVAPLVEAMAK